MSSHDGDEIKSIAALIIGGGFFFVKGFRDLRLHRKIAGLATSKTRSMAMGVVELAGVAKAIDGNHLDPVYSRPCCYFNLKVEQYRRSGKRGSWVTIHEDSSDGKPFLCRDTAGEVTILPAKPDLHFSTRCVQQNGLFNSCEPAVKNFFNSRWSGWSSLRLTLDVLRDGDPFFVMGCAMTRRTGNPVSLADAARKLKADAAQMKKMDLNNDGHVDAQEWELGMQKFKAFVDGQTASFEGIVTRAEEVELIFANTEKDLLSKLGPLAYLEILGGGLALFGGIAWLLMRLGMV